MQSPRRGQIYRLKSDNVGKPRPVLIVSPVELNGGSYLSGVPFTSQQLEKRRTLRQCVWFAAGEFGLTSDCVVKADEVGFYKISDLRISEGPLGQVDETKMRLVSAALCYALGIEAAG